MISVQGIYKHRFSFNHLLGLSSLVDLVDLCNGLIYFVNWTTDGNDVRRLATKAHRHGSFGSKDGIQSSVLRSRDVAMVFSRDC